MFSLPSIGSRESKGEVVGLWKKTRRDEGEIESDSKPASIEKELIEVSDSIWLDDPRKSQKKERSM